MKQTLCELTGHDWQPTTAPNYQRCQRSGCKAAQRLTGTRWVEVARRTTPQPHAGAVAQVLMGGEVQAHG